MTKKDVVNPSAPATVSELPDGPADDNGLTTRQQLILDVIKKAIETNGYPCLLYTSPSPRDRQKSRMPSSA